jgi:hypothetical protein
MWAVLDHAPKVVHLYERVDGVWRFSSVPDSDVEAAGLAADASGVWVALSGLDPGITEPRKSVRLYHRGDGWRLVSRNPTAATYTEIRQLHVMALPGGVTLTWSEAHEEAFVMARVGIGLDRPGRGVRVDDSSGLVRPFRTTSGEPAWLVQHDDADARSAELRLLRLDGERTRVTQAVPLPFTGFFTALAEGPDGVFVTGAEFDPDPTRPTVRSLNLRLTPSCH